MTNLPNSPFADKLAQRMDDLMTLHDKGVDERLQLLNQLEKCNIKNPKEVIDRIYEGGVTAAYNSVIGVILPLYFLLQDKSLTDHSLRKYQFNISSSILNPEAEEKAKKCPIATLDLVSEMLLAATGDRIND